MNYEDRVTKEYVEGLLAEMPKLVIGTYTGNGTAASGVYTQRITLGYQPKALLIVGHVSGASQSLNCDFANSAALTIPGLIPRTPGNVAAVEITDDGFTVKSYFFNGSWMPPSLNDNGSTYLYIALK